MNNLKQLKSTLIGGILFLLGCFFLWRDYTPNPDHWDYLLSVILIIFGIGFLLVPEKFIDLIINFLKSKFKK